MEREPLMKNIVFAATFLFASAAALAVPPAPRALIIAQATSADPNQLSAQEIQRAIHGEGKDHWIEIEDMGLTAAHGAGTPKILLFMPEAVLAMKSESAKKQFLAYDPTDEEKRRSLTTSAHGFVGKTAREGCASITRVILLS